MREKLHEFCYTKKDFVLEWFSGTGAGGQHRNKHKNCLRLSFLPGNITVTANGRDRSTNLRNAWASIKPKIEAWIRAQVGEKDYPRNYDVVRSYNIPDNRVIDHASGKQILWSDIEKQFGLLVEARKRYE